MFEQRHQSAQGQIALVGIRNRDCCYACLEKRENSGLYIEKVILMVLLLYTTAVKHK